MRPTHLSTINFVPLSGNGALPEVRDTEWRAAGSATQCEFIPDPEPDEETENHTSARDPIGTLQITVIAVVQRHYMVHMYRVVLVMGFLSLMAVASLCDDPQVRLITYIIHLSALSPCIAARDRTPVRVMCSGV